MTADDIARAIDPEPPMAQPDAVLRGNLVVMVHCEGRSTVSTAPSERK
jgi:hypothetical protein